jgi:hypothetical protein
VPLARATRRAPSFGISSTRQITFHSLITTLPPA